MSTTKFVLNQNLIRGSVMDTELAKVFKDAYPKAQCHYLILPKEDIPNVQALTRDHIELLDHMKDLANQIIEQQHLPSSNFLIGFKMDALMDRLTMHVISDDFFSQSMKRVQHWNSFHTDLFITYQAVYALLRMNATVEPLSAERAKELRVMKLLHCNQCDFQSESLLSLKLHLFHHWKARENKYQCKQQVDKVITMLAETKLDVVSTNDIAGILSIPEKSSEAKTLSWRQMSNHKNNNNNINTEHAKPKEQPISWRQTRESQLTSEQTPASHYNDFAKHFQKQNNRQASNVEPQRNGMQNFFNNPRGQQFPEHDLFQFMLAFNKPNNYQNVGFHLQQFAQNGQNRMPHFNNFIRMPNMEQQQRNSRFPMQLIQVPQQQQGHPQPNRPHFNPFRQKPNVQQDGPNQNTDSMPQHKQNQNSADSRPNKANQNKPKWTPKPPSNPGKNTNNKGPDKAPNQGKNMHVKPNSK